MGKMVQTSCSQKYMWKYGVMVQAFCIHTSLQIKCGLDVSGCVFTELKITVSHQPFSDHFQTILRDLAKQIQFARTNLLHIFNGEAE